MAQSLSNLLIHLVFSTKNRQPFIRKEIEDELYKYIYGICENLECPLHQIGGVDDHIHILFSLSRKTALSEFVNKLKSSSSVWIKRKGDNYRNFSWQNGYGGFSIGKSGFDNTVKYIANQKAHHQKRSFQEEFLILLQKYDISYDEKYLWD